MMFLDFSSYLDAWHLAKRGRLREAFSEGALVALSAGVRHLMLRHVSPAIKELAVEPAVDVLTQFARRYMSSRTNMLVFHVVAKLVDSVVNFQARSRDIIEEMRVLATKNADEIRESVEDGKQRLAKLMAQGGTLPRPTGI